MYQVWTKGDEYSGWAKIDCAELKAALASVLLAIKSGKEPLLTQEVKYEFEISVKEDKIGEATESKAQHDKGPAGKSHGTVRRGDEAAPEGLDKGSGDNRPDPGAGDRA